MCGAQSIQINYQKDWSFLDYVEKYNKFNGDQIYIFLTTISYTFIYQKDYNLFAFSSSFVAQANALIPPHKLIACITFEVLLSKSLAFAFS